MNRNKEKEEISLIGRLFSMEAFLLLMGFFCLGSGIYRGEWMQLFWGGMIISGAVALHFVRKRDWKKHWEEQERMHKALEERRQREKEEKEK